MFPTHPRRAAALFLAAVSLALAACDGGNAFILDPTDPVTGTDATAPTVQIELPASGATTVAVGDSVFVRARAADNRRIAKLTFEGFALRGDASLGTQVAVRRYTTKEVDLSAGAAVRDTTVSRYLLAGTDSTPERNVLIVVTAADSAGNESKDTTLVNIGGPRITIMAPAPDAEFRGGTQFSVRLQAEDRTDQIRSIRLRATGAFTLDSLITLRASAPLVDTTLVILIPNVQGNLRLEATAVSGANITGNGRPVDVRITTPTPDTQAPRVTFNAAVQSRAEPDDSIEVSVQAVDETRVDSVGATVLAIRRTATRADTVAVMHGRARASTATFTFNLSALQLNGLAVDSFAFEVTAYAVDPAHNCGASTTPLSAQSLPCRPGPQASRLADISGKEYLVFVARGSTIAYPHPGDVIADVVADSQRVYLSNFTWNRVDVLPLGSNVYVDSVRVGSEPWGLAIGRFRDSLYVANSGGTNISVIPLRNPGALQEDQGKRIFTRNERLYSVELNNVGGVERVVEYDYSDRPQFLAQASNGLLVFSTRPSPAVADGTVRLLDPRKTRSEIFTGYVGRHTAQRAIVVNADSAFKIESLKWVRVCPRRRFGDASDPPCIDGLPDDVSDSLTALRARPANPSGGKWDTRLDMGAFIDEVGFADTTFVAASGDRRFVAVGEGARRANARIPMFEASGDSLILRGDIRDLISNTGERVIGLGLNRDGSLGVARGNVAYFFTSTLRLQGVRESGSPTGGVAMHPGGVNYPNGPNRLAFVSGTEGGRPYIDVIDAFSFFRVKRIFIRDPVVGALVVAPRAASDLPAVDLRLYAITTRGLLSLQVTLADLQQ